MNWILVAFGVWGWTAALVWLGRLISGGLAYRRAPRVPTRKAPSDAPHVSILVPARNEESNITDCLKALAGQEYPRFEVIAINDNSRDRTPELIAAAQRENPGIVAAEAPPTPEGWTGKNRALVAGMERARGEWLLFTDADARLGPNALSSAICHARERGLDLLSLLPRAITGSLVERMLQPAAMGHLGWWFPLQRINDPADPLAFGNGQFLLIRREAYEALGGHSSVREAYLEDVALARAAKKRGLKVECALGKRLFAVRMYDSLKRYLEGWRRIYLHAFDRRPGVLLGKALEVGALSVIPFLCLISTLILLLCGALGREDMVLVKMNLSREGWILAAGPALSLALSTFFAGKVQSALGVRWRYALFHPLAATVMVGILLCSALAATTGAPTRWR